MRQSNRWVLVGKAVTKIVSQIAVIICALLKLLENPHSRLYRPLQHIELSKQSKNTLCNNVYTATNKSPRNVHL